VCPGMLGGRVTANQRKGKIDREQCRGGELRNKTWGGKTKIGLVRFQHFTSWDSTSIWVTFSIRMCNIPQKPRPERNSRSVLESYPHSLTRKNAIGSGQEFKVSYRQERCAIKRPLGEAWERSGTGRGGLTVGLLTR